MSSVIGFGAMQIPGVSERAAVETLRRAIDLGVNYIETASGYGDSEVKIGKAIKGIGRNLIVSSKASPESNSTGDAMRRKIESSLKRLGLDYLTFYQIHGLNNMEIFDAVMKKGGPLDGLEEAKREGIIGHIGFTTHAPAEDIIRMIRSGRFESVGLLYNLLYRQNEKVIEIAHKSGIGVVIIAPLSKGMLNKPPDKFSLLLEPYKPVEFGYRFLASNPCVSTIAAGMSSVKEVEDNVRTGDMDYPLSGEELRVLRRVDGQFESLGNTFCDYCRKCLPCPKEINIPEVLQLRNLYHAYGVVEYAKDRYKLLESGGSWYPGVKADKCNDCEECEKRCPRKLRIIVLLKEIHGLLYEKGTRKRLFT
jgi:predicted aldo/keto reductase-like oxidoreductase